MRIVLIGFMCSGKSKVGQALSKKLNVPHFDTDKIVEEKAGLSVAEIINGQGEAKFRSLENEAVSQVSSEKSCVISTGGGIPLSAENMKSLQKDGKVVWLKVKPKTVLKRLGDVKARPLLSPGDPLKSIEILLEKRQPFYSVADFQVDTDNKKPNEIVETIVTSIS